MVKFKNVWFAGAAIAGMMVWGCGAGGGEGTVHAQAGSGKKPLVAFAQANSQDPWRQVFDAEIKAAAAEHSEHLAYEQQDAQDDPSKQINHIETMLVKQPKVLLVSPVTEAVQGVVEKAHDQGIPVILLDRGIPGDKYTAFIGGDNVQIGREAAEFIVKSLGGKGTVLMIQGLGGATATIDRRDGAMEVFRKHADIVVIEGDDCKYQREAARNFMENFIQSGRHFDAVYAHNDEMAIGAFYALQAANAPKKVIVGVDGCQAEIVEMIRDGKIDATLTYPIPGAAGLELAADILRGEKPRQKKIILPTQLVTKENAAQFLKDNQNLAR
jgi:ribose transport system substrate-binding protein